MLEPSAMTLPGAVMTCHRCPSQCIPREVVAVSQPIQTAEGEEAVTPGLWAGTGCGIETGSQRLPFQRYAVTFWAGNVNVSPVTHTLPAADADSACGSRLRLNPCHLVPFQWKTSPGRLRLP